ncbi:lipocalin family protein [Spirosoma sp.]|uniref:lipocalin family protein n=1 Tax=Spirosoma sp. TaxID=1899569 RepID=UPI003B3AB245
MAKKFNTNHLCREWIHSAEEDSPEEAVFRPADYAFPLTRRPRDFFTLHADGSLVKGQGTSSDSLQEDQGHWDLTNNEISFHTQDEQVETYQIGSINPNKLVLKK